MLARRLQEFAFFHPPPPPRFDVGDLNKTSSSSVKGVKVSVSCSSLSEAAPLLVLFREGTGPAGSCVTHLKVNLILEPSFFFSGNIKKSKKKKSIIPGGSELKRHKGAFSPVASRWRLHRTRVLPVAGRRRSGRPQATPWRP